MRIAHIIYKPIDLSLTWLVNHCNRSIIATEELPNTSTSDAYCILLFASPFHFSLPQLLNHCNRSTIASEELPKILTSDAYCILLFASPFDSSLTGLFNHCSWSTIATEELYPPFGSDVYYFAVFLVWCLLYWMRIAQDLASYIPTIEWTVEYANRLLRSPSIGCTLAHFGQCISGRRGSSADELPSSIVWFCNVSRCMPRLRTYAIVHRVVVSLLSRTIFFGVGYV